MDGTVRRATPADLEEVTRTISLAFAEDPLWTWAFPDGRGVSDWWRLLIRSALPHGWVWVAGDGGAAAVWIPPGRTELTAAEESQVPHLLAALLGPRAPAVLELLARFEAAHPRQETHYYLSLLGTRPDRRGHGIGMDLLAANLRLIDTEGHPAYLESSNPANDARYERLGFRPVGSFSTPDGAHRATTMWRGAEPPASS